jgi:uncharacterized membrane protein
VIHPLPCSCGLVPLSKIIYSFPSAAVIINVLLQLPPPYAFMPWGLGVVSPLLALFSLFLKVVVFDIIL